MAATMHWRVAERLWGKVLPGTIAPTQLDREQRSMVSMPRLAVIVAPALAAALVGAGYAYYQEEAPQSYLTAAVARGSISTLVKATGTVNAVVTVDVSSQLSGRIADVFVNFNDMVKSGQPIARVDPETYVARVNEARAALKIAQANVELQIASLERARAA
ncbi:MAG: biotin/lipoyl-binding protein, partial [Deltaproteobacteria bacterium]|nr:biotin/lipoyl-binding protein [Deltaproteobacteria bacterium]